MLINLSYRPLAEIPGRLWLQVMTVTIIIVIIGIVVVVTAVLDGFHFDWFVVVMITLMM